MTMTTETMTGPAYERLGDGGAHHHYWQGAFIGDEEAGRRLEDLPAAVEAALATVLETETVLAACDALAAALCDPAHPVRVRLAAHLPEGRTRPCWPSSAPCWAGGS